MEKLHDLEQRHYTYICRHCEKRITTLRDVFVRAEENVPPTWPDKWAYVHCYGEFPIVLCDVCFEKFKPLLIELRNKILKW